MSTPEKSFIAVDPNSGATYRFNETDWQEKKDRFVSKYPDAEIMEYDAYNPEETQQNDDIFVSTENGAYSFSPDEWAEKQERFMAKYPKASVGRVRAVNYWGDKAAEQEQAIKEKRQSMMSVPQNATELWGNNPDYLRNLNELEEMEKAYKENPYVQQKAEEEKSSLRKLKEATENDYAAFMKEYEDVIAAGGGGTMFHQGSEDAMMQGFARSVGAMRKGKDHFGRQVEYDMQKPLFDAAIQNISGAEDLLDKPNQSENNGNAVANVFKGIGAKYGSAEFWSRGMNKLVALNQGGNAAIEKINRKLQEGGENLTEDDIDNILSPAEKAYVFSLMEVANAQAQRAPMDTLPDYVNAERKVSKAYQIGEGIAEMTGFIAEFIATGNITDAATSGATKVVQGWLIKNLMAKGGKALAQKAARGLSKVAVNALTKTASAAMKSAVRTAAMGATGGLGGNIATQRTTLQEDGTFKGTGESILGGTYETAVENFTEEMGPVITDLLGAPFKPLAKPIKDYLKGIDYSDFGKLESMAKKVGYVFDKSTPMAKALAKGGYHGTVEEYGEELLGALIRGEMDEFFDKDQQLVLIGTFAPMAVLGMGGSAAHVIRSTKEVKAAAENLRLKLKESGIDGKQIDYLTDYVRSTSAEKMGKEFSPLIGRMAQESGLGQSFYTSDTYKAVARYIKAVAEYQTIDSQHKEQEGQQRTDKQAELEEKYGKFYNQSDNSVNVVQLKDGKVVYQVTDFAENGEAGAVDMKDGKPITFRAEDVQTYTDKEGKTHNQESGKMSLDSYLSSEIMKRKESAQTARMREDRQRQISELTQSLPNSFDLGTEADPYSVAVKSHDANGVTVVDEKGNEMTLPWDKVGRLMNKPIKVLTDSELAEAEAAEMALKVEAVRAKNAKTSKEAQEVETDTAAIDEEVKSLQPNPEDLYTDKETGEVDEVEFWKNDPEGYCEWNDKRQQDGGIDSMKQIANARAALEGVIKKAEKEAKTDNPVTRRTAEGILFTAQQQLDKYAAIEQQYAERNSTQEEKRAEEVIAMRERASFWREKLNLGDNLVVLESLDEVKNPIARRTISLGRTEGWYDNKEGKVYLYLPDIASTRVLDKKVMHEIVTHYGLDHFLNESEYAKLTDMVWNIMSDTAKRNYYNYTGVSSIKDPTMRRRRAAEEFIAKVAEDVNFDNANAETKSIWQRILDFFKKLFEKDEINLAANEIAEALNKNIKGLVVGNEKKVEEFKAQAAAQAQAHQETAQPEVSQAEVDTQVETILNESGLSVMEDLAENVMAQAETMTNENGIPLTSNTNDGTELFSTTTAKPWTDNLGNEHKGTMEMVLERMQQMEFSEQEIRQMEAKMQTAYDYMMKLQSLTNPDGSVRFEEFNAWAEKTPLYKQVGRDFVKAITSLVSNGDYPINLELTTDCIKREAFTMLLNELVKRGADLAGMGPAEIVTIQKMMKQYGIQVACALCFVEGKRLQIVNWASQIVNDWNDALIEAGVETDEMFEFGKDGDAFIPSEEWRTYEDKPKLAKALRTIDEVARIFQGVDPKVYKAQKAKNEKALKKYIKEKEEAAAKKGKKWTPTDEQKREMKKIKVAGLTPTYVNENMKEYTAAFEQMRNEWVAKSPKKGPMRDPLDFTPTKTQWDELEKIRNRQIENVKQKMVRLIMEYPEMRKKMTLNDLLGSKGLMEIRQQHGVAYEQLYSIILQRFGTGTPKPVQDAVPYDGEVMTLTESAFKAANKIGGARLFSFSDFDITKVFDYMQMFFDLEANRQMLQSYTKEVAAILLFGKSNAKFNISTLASAVVPAKVLEEYENASEGKRKDMRHQWAENAGLLVDENGTITGINFSEEHSVSPEFAQQIFHDDSRNKDCGAIMVGASVNHAIYSAAQAWIRMVIPFHLSGMPIAARDKTDVKWWTDNTEYQSTRKKTKDGWSKISDKENTFEFYADMHQEGWNMRDKAREYLDWCKDNAFRPKFDWGINSDYYKAYCEENGYTPNQQIIDMMDADTTNGVWNQYYKFLTDFTAYKPVFNEEGEMIDEIPSPQQRVISNFDMSEMEKQVIFEGENSMLARREGNIALANQHVSELADKVTPYLNGQITEEEMELRDDVFYDARKDANAYLEAKEGEDILFSTEKETRVIQEKIVSLPYVSEAIETGKWNEDAQNELNKIVEDVEQGLAILKRYTPQEHRGLLRGGRLLVGASILSRGSEADIRTTKRGYESLREKADRTIPLITEWAKSNGVWHEYSERGESEILRDYLDSGTEAQVFNLGNGFVEKIIGLDYFVDPQLALDRIAIHNALFPETNLNVVGFGTNKRGEFAIIVHQQTIAAFPTEQEKINAYIESLGFELVDDEAHTFVNEELYLSDLHSSNVLSKDDQKYYIIDGDFRLNTPDAGEGGTRETDDTIVYTNDNNLFSTRTDEDRAKLFDAAMQKYGVTNNFNAAGYMLPDGSLLDFSEANDGGDPNRRSLDHRDIEGIIMDEGREYDSRHMYIVDFMNEGAIRMMPESDGINLSVAPSAGQREKLLDYFYKRNGYIILEISNETGGSVAYVEYDKGTSPYRILKDIDGYFNEGIVPQNDILFSTSNNNQRIFVSNAAKAVEGIKQDKATPEQWLKMIEKNGGLKAGEDKWMGLSDWLKASDKKTLTKAEVLDFINEHMIQIEEVHYDAYAEERASDAHSNIVGVLQNKFNDYVAEYHEEHGYDDEYDDPASKYAIERLREEMEDTFPYTIELAYGNEVFVTFDYEEEDEMVKWAEKTGVNYIPGENPINSTRLNYTTDGLNNKHEIALTVPNIESWNEGDVIHFGDAGDGRAIAWIRFGEAKVYAETKEGKEYKAFVDNMLRRYHIDEKVKLNRFGTIVVPQELLDALTDEQFYELQRLKIASMGATDKTEQNILVIDEIQSKRHQEGREKGYLTIEDQLKKKQFSKADAEHDAVVAELHDKYGDRLANAETEEEVKAILTEEELARLTNTYEELVSAEEAKEGIKTDIPDAPFEKNWHELAMKRMLRYAAENGYDAIAWTKGEQQAERYGIGKVVSSVGYRRTDDGKRVRVNMRGGESLLFDVDVLGKVTEVHRGDMISKGMSLSEIVGADLAKQIDNYEGEVDERGDYNIKSENFRIGGEGMKGFYDKMLPAFMNKYGKKWGIKVEDIELPNLEEAGRIMHSVPVTDEMKESVMEGQLMFSFMGRKGAANLDKARHETWLLDNLDRAIQNEGKFDAKTLKAATGWERGADGKWRHEEPDDVTLRKDKVEELYSNALFNDQMHQQGKYERKDANCKLSELIDAPQLFRAYPQLANVKVNVYRMATGWGASMGKEMDLNFALFSPEGRQNGWDALHDTIIHEIQHEIQDIEGFAKGGSAARGGSYFDLAGEVEADNVVARKRMSYPERLYRLAEETEYMPREEQVVRGALFDNEESTVMFSTVTDPLKVAKLESGKKIPAYRAIQIDENGQLYSPMASRLKSRGRRNEAAQMREWDQSVENLDLVTRGEEYGKITILDEDGGQTYVAYNPYGHCCVNSMMNDQFKRAWERDGLYVMKVEVPESELTSGYKAEQAKDAVGIHKWKTGAVGRKLPESKRRQILLTRWMKNVQVMTWEEVAQDWIKTLKGENIDVPFNVIPRKILNMLADAGVKIVAPEKGMENALSAYKEWKKDPKGYVGDTALPAHVAALNENKPSDPNGGIRFSTKSATFESAITPEVRKEMDVIAAQAIVNGNYLLAPNGQPTKLTPEQWALVRTKNFLNWFGDWINNPENASKVVDENGEPMVVYHGTAGVINKFEDQQRSPGFWFVDREDVANGYAESAAGEFGEEKNVIPVFLNLRNPRIEDAQEGYPAEFALRSYVENDNGVYEVFDTYDEAETYRQTNVPDGWIGAAEVGDQHDLVERAKELGHDGVIMLNMHDQATYAETRVEGTQTNYVVLDANQIKSATENNGEYSKSNDILFSTRQPNESAESFFKQTMRDYVKKYGNLAAIIIEPVNEETAKKYGYTVEELKKVSGAYLGKRGVAIFAQEDVIDSDEVESTIYHETLHHLIKRYPNLLETGKYFWDLAENDEWLKIIKDDIEESYSDKPIEEKYEEMLCYAMELYAGLGGIEALIEQLSDQARIDVEFILNKTKYGRLGKVEGVSKDSSRSEEDSNLDRQDESESRSGEDAEGTTLFSTAGREKSVEEIVEEGKQKVSAEHTQTVDAFMDRIRRINGNLQQLRMAAAAQREYDQKTVKTITDIANDLLEGGALTDLTRGEIKRLLSIINGGVGKSDLTKSVDRLMDLMVANQLRYGKNLIEKFLKIRGSKVDQRGVEVRGTLDIPGQQILNAFKEGIGLSKEKLADRIADAEDALSSDSETKKRNAENELVGFYLAKQYHEDINDSIEEEKDLRNEIKVADEDYKAGKITKEMHKQLLDTIYEAILENRIQRVNAYEKLASDLGAKMVSSIKNAGLLRDAEKERVQKIQHFANSDMQGMPADMHGVKENRFWNSPLVRFFLKPLATFDQMLRSFAPKSTSGEGYLWNHFMGGWTKATESEYKGVQEAHEMLDSAARTMFGEGVERWSDLFAKERKMPKITIKVWDNGEMVDKEISQGNALYIYMVNKMTDGKMKLRKMGISQEDVDAIVAQMDPRFITLADWMQERFLPSLRDKYNAVHERLFGAPMASIDNYFPIKVNPGARTREVDVEAGEGTAKPATITGSIIKRTKNSLALDIMNADAFDVMLEHIQQMEHWAAFAEFNKDLNTLLSYRKFRNRVENMSGIYGSGKTVWSNFKTVAEIAAGVYQPASKSDSLDKTALNVAKGVTGAKISFRVYTAIKQLLSMPAFVSDANIKILAKNIATPWIAWNWAMENLPMFEKRWKSRQAGDTRLMQTDSDWKIWKYKIVELAGRYGMTPNAFIDAVTVSIGARSIYETKYQSYLDMGYSEEQADKKAKQDATILFNESQQSNESAFLSTVQVDRTVASVAFTVFRNSAMGYQRMAVDAWRNISHMMRKGYKEESIEYMKKQMVRDGLTEEQAERAATRVYNRSFAKNAARLVTFQFLVQFAWNLGAYLPYLLVGDDDDEKKAMVKDAAIRGLVGGPIEGMAGGSIVSNMAGNLAMGEKLSDVNTTLLPVISDIEKTIKMLDYDKVAAYNEMFNILIQSGIGVNPQTFTDIIVAIEDACNGEPQTSKEVALCIMRALQVPQSQLEKVFFDEIDFTVDKGLDLTIEEFAKRYANYKVNKGTPLTGWMYKDEVEKEREDKYIKRFLETAEELKRSRGNEEAKKYYEYLDNDYKETTETLNELKRKAQDSAMKGEQMEAMEYAKMLTDFMETDLFKDYVKFGGKAKAIERIRDKMKKVDMQTRESLEERMLELRKDMVEEMEKANL